tara:strand:+ start:3325 stop:3543 length:219 start_codon:yes stop_codon:yes gene_type:complete
MIYGILAIAIGLFCIVAPNVLNSLTFIPKIGRQHIGGQIRRPSLINPLWIRLAGVLLLILGILNLFNIIKIN